MTGGRGWREPVDHNSVSPEDGASHQLLKEQMEGMLDSLTPRERRVLQLRFGLEDGRSRTLEEVGRDFNVTRERIRQIEAKALRKLRHPSRSRKLKDYIEIGPPRLTSKQQEALTRRAEEEASREALLIARRMEAVTRGLDSLGLSSSEGEYIQQLLSAYDSQLIPEALASEVTPVLERIAACAAGFSGNTIGSRGSMPRPLLAEVGVLESIAERIADSCSRGEPVVAAAINAALLRDYAAHYGACPHVLAIQRMDSDGQLAALRRAIAAGEGAKTPKRAIRTLGPAPPHMRFIAAAIAALGQD